MKVASVVGRGADAFSRRLAAALGERGRTARLARVDTTTDGGALLETDPVETTYELGEDRVHVTGPARELPAVLDELAPTHDYAVVSGHPEARLPAVVLGDEPRDGPVAIRLSAGDPDVGDALEAVEATEPHETLSSLVARAKRSPEAARAGAIATFTGRVRAHDDPDDDETTHLEFETYEGVADERMAGIAGELEEREGVFEVVMHHRTGVVEAGEDIVFVVVLAGHRAEAFATVSDGIDRLKDEVPIFKKEVTVDGEFWAHDRP